MKKRMTREERIKKIKNAAIKVFLEKGFRNTVMDDIMQATGLSRGGLYHYYSSTTDILYDLMSDGNRYRDKIISQTLTQKKHLGISVFVEVIIDKMLAENDHVSIYVMFLCELERDDKLKILYQKLKEDSISSVKEIFRVFGYEIFDDKVFEFITNIINASLMACELLDARPNLVENKKSIQQMLEIYFKNIFLHKDGDAGT